MNHDRPVRTRIDGGFVWTPTGLRSGSVLIEGERIAGVCSPADAAGWPAEHIISAEGSWVLPGGVDLHVHISDGAETFDSGSRCAAAGGVTTLLDMAPFHACVMPEQFWAKVARAEAECVVDFGLIAGIVANVDDLRRLGELAPLGAGLFKVFMPAQPPLDSTVLWPAVLTAARTGLRLMLHAEDMACVSPVDWSDPLGFPRSRPAVAEAAATALVLEMAHAAGAPVHICHVSAARTAELIAAARARGTDVTAEVPAHFLVLDETEFARQGPRVKTTPPLRTRADADALWQALAEGVIDALASDHFRGSLDPAPRDPSLTRSAAAGIAGLEVSLPLLFSAGVQAGRLTLARFVSATAERPATIAGLSGRKGRLAAGHDADLVLWDPQATWTVARQGDFSRAATTPFEGWPLRGRVLRTLVRGHTVWEASGQAVPRASGKHVPSRSEAG